MTDASAQPPLRAVDGGVMLTAKAFPGARRNEIRMASNGEIHLAVTQIAEQGKANAAFVALLARALGLPKSRVRLVHGAQSRNKVFLLDADNVTELQSSLERVSKKR